MHKHHNGLKTAALFGVLWAVLLGLGAVIGSSMRSATPIWIMALVGVGTTAYGYWNSDKIALRAMQAALRSAKIGPGSGSGMGGQGRRTGPIRQQVRPAP